MHEPWRVLIVDDDPDVHDFLDTLFRIDERFEVVGHAHEGRTAVAGALRLRPDAVVLDLSMPGLDGWQALPDLRRRLPGVVIIVFTAYPDPVSLLQILEAGADDYLDKASAWELLPVLVEQLARRHRGSRHSA